MKLLLAFCFLAAPASAQVKFSTHNMTLIAAGTFYMGAPSFDGYDNEKPRHLIYLDSFWMDQYEVTAKDYRPFAEESKRILKAQPFPDDALAPVVYVSWDDAHAYCKSIGKRLPTEAEWEKAARGGTNSQYSFGNQDEMLKEYAWYFVNGNKELHPVGQLKPNDYGLYDMHGNVLEWTADYFDPDYYQRSPKKNPQGPEEGKYRSVRGGSVYLSAKLQRVTHRMKGKQETRYSGRGFRCAASSGDSD